MRRDALPHWAEATLWTATRHRSVAADALARLHEHTAERLAHAVAPDERTASLALRQSVTAILDSIGDLEELTAAHIDDALAHAAETHPWAWPYSRLDLA